MKVDFTPQLMLYNNKNQNNYNSVSFERLHVRRNIHKAVREVEKFDIKPVIASILVFLGLKENFKTGDLEFDSYVDKELGYGGHFLPMHSATLGQMKEIHERLKDHLNILRKIHLTKDGSGKTPMYNATLEQMQEIHRVFKDDGKTLAKIHLSKNKKGKIKAHNVETEGLLEIHRVFENDINTLTKIHLTKNKKGLLPVHYATKEGIDEIILKFICYPKALNKIFGQPDKFPNNGTRDYIKKELESIIYTDKNDRNIIKDLLEKYE